MIFKQISCIKVMRALLAKETVNSGRTKPCTAFLGFVFRQFSKDSKRNHYDELELKQTASQKDIKSAYYRLSMKHHPDRSSQDSEMAHEKFRRITEAYEVLGNAEMRASYDAKLFNRQIPRQAPGVVYGREHIRRSPFDNRSFKKRYPTPGQGGGGGGGDFSHGPPTGHTPQYNYDEFYRMHYGAAMKNHASKKYYYEKKKGIKEEADSELSAVFIFLCLSVAVYAILGGIHAIFSGYIGDGKDDRVYRNKQSPGDLTTSPVVRNSSSSRSENDVDRPR